MFEVKIIVGIPKWDHVTKSYTVSQWAGAEERKRFTSLDSAKRSINSMFGKDKTGADPAKFRELKGEDMLPYHWKQTVAVKGYLMRGQGGVRGDTLVMFVVQDKEL